MSFQPLAPLSHWESLDVWNWRFSRNQLRKVWMAWEVQFEIDPRNSWLHHVRGIKQHLSFDTSSKQCGEETEFWTKNRVRVIPNPTCTNLMCLAVCPIKKQTNKPMWIIARRTLGLVKTQPRNTFLPQENYDHINLWGCVWTWVLQLSAMWSILIDTHQIFIYF